MVGREGAVGGIVSQGHLPAFSRAVVHGGRAVSAHRGCSARRETAHLEQAKLASLTLRHLFARYADCLLAQVFQSVACNAAHTIEQRTAKWLLAALDRTGEREVPLTQEQLAAMLGVGRSYISRVIQALKAEGALMTRRGGLGCATPRCCAGLTCGCDEAVRAHFEAGARRGLSGRREGGRTTAPDDDAGHRAGGSSPATESSALERLQVAHRAAGGAGGQRRIGLQRRRDHALARRPAARPRRRAPPSPRGGAASSASGTARWMRAVRDVDLDACRRPRPGRSAPPSAASGETWPMRQAGGAAGEAAVGDQRAGLAEALRLQVAGRVQHLLHAGAAARALVADHHHVAGLRPCRRGCRRPRRPGFRRRAPGR